MIHELCTRTTAHRAAPGTESSELRSTCSFINFLLRPRIRHHFVAQPFQNASTLCSVRSVKWMDTRWISSLSDDFAIKQSFFNCFNCFWSYRFFEMSVFFDTCQSILFLLIRIGRGSNLNDWFDKQKDEQRLNLRPIRNYCWSKNFSLR